jgi:light-regulated signal transduction histidine kinase (bacteriophytochrome)
MKNMGSMASMSVSVPRVGRLWGLISCHSWAAHHVSPIFAVQAAAQEQMQETAHRVELRSVQMRLPAYISTEENFTEVLVRHREELRQVADAAVAIADLLRKRKHDVFATDRLLTVMPGAARFKHTASGLLAASSLPASCRLCLVVPPRSGEDRAVGWRPAKAS